MSTTRVQLPTEADYTAAHHALSKGYDAVEAVAWRLRDILAALEPEYAQEDEGRIRIVKPDPPTATLDRPPTATDVGLLYSFLSDARLVMTQLDEKLGQVARFLDVIDGHRIEAQEARKSESA